MFEVTVNTRRAVVGTKELITTSSAGIQVQFTFSEDWDSLSKIAIFRNGDDANLIPVAVPNSNLVTIPAQSCSEDFVDEPLFVGVYGTDGLGAVIIPTVWTSLGVLRPGAVTTDIITPAEPTPDMWAQILAIANEAAAIADECEANEELRVAAEQLRAGAETARANAEALRAAAEDARAENENQRQGAETQRQVAEDARAQAEALRIQAEELRQANETSRASAESDRASAEQTRQTNEATRASNEAARVTTEQNRASAETQRASAESSRVTEETSRVSAESSRATAEQDRASAETARASAESQRVTAENNRVSAEQNRVNAEDERVQAETDRATEFATWENTIASKVPNTRTVNGKALSTDITLDAGDIGYDPTETYQAGSVGAELQEQTRQLSDVESAITDFDDVLHILGTNLQNSTVIDTSGWNTLLSGFDLKSGVTYTVTLTLSSAISGPLYALFKDENNVTFSSRTLQSGDTGYTQEITPSADANNCRYMVFYNQSAITASISIISASGETAIDEIEGEIADLDERISGEIDDLSNAVQSNITSKIINHVSTNHLDKTKTGTGLIKPDGSIDSEITTVTHSDYIEVSPGTNVRMMYVSNGANESITFRYAFYNSDKTFNGGTETGVTRAIAPENTAYIRVSCGSAYYEYNMAVTFDTITPEYVYEDYFEPFTSYTEDFLTEQTKNIIDAFAQEDVPFFANAGTLSGTNVLRLAAPHAKRNYTISFRGKISTFGTLTVGIGKDSSYLGGWIEIDSTNIKVYTKESTSAILEGTYPHSLTFSEMISVDIRATGIHTCEIVLSTVGGQFKTESAWFGCLGFALASGYQGRVTAETSGGSFTDCSLSYYCADYKHELWGFGDSYFDHWPEVAITNGFGCFAVDGASGRHSAEAWHSLELESAKRIPKKILWCMGMNDEDSTDTSENPTVNTSWLYNYNKVKNFCTKYGIELILVTIPCVPARNNRGKNKIIRESGYRYVDVAEAVGGSAAGSSWYTGLLSSDNVHPSTLGDKAIAARFIADVPELMGE